MDDLSSTCSSCVRRLGRAGLPVQFLVGAAASSLPEHGVLCLGGSCGDSWCLAEVQMITLCVPDTHIRRGGCRGEEIRLMADVMWVGFFLFRGGKKQDAAQPGEEKLCGVVTAGFLCLRVPAGNLERDSLSGTVEMGKGVMGSNWKSQNLG